ncbi:MAG: type II toxin-antitoxin system VapC family toxin [Pirellulales bacterium]
MIFVDTGVWFAANVSSDHDHLQARALLRRRQSSLVTTDYVLCELFTLLKVRGQRSRLPLAGRAFFEQRVCHVEHVSSADVVAAWNVFERFRDKDWSFTDCTSYVVMRRLGIVEAAAFDEHFRQFGFVTVLP